MVLRFDGRCPRKRSRNVFKFVEVILFTVSQTFRFCPKGVTKIWHVDVARKNKNKH